jgi:hypothetical protein
MWGFGIQDILHPVFPYSAASQYWTKVQYTGFRFFDRKNSLQSVAIPRWMSDERPGVVGMDSLPATLTRRVGSRVFKVRA